MQNLKFLQISAALLLFTAFLGGCAGSRKVSSPDAAEKMAVELANDKCQHEFGKRPFRTGSFPATRSGDRWLWGWLDAKVGRGFTAQVSFHADKSEPQVVVSYGADLQADMEEPDAPSLNGSGNSGMLSFQPEPVEAD